MNLYQMNLIKKSIQNEILDNCLTIDTINQYFLFNNSFNIHISKISKPYYDPINSNYILCDIYNDNQNTNSILKFNRYEPYISANNYNNILYISLMNYHIIPKYV
jgi:hypothetical protein